VSARLVAVRVAVGLVLALTPCAALAPSAAWAATPRASLTDVENDVMCVACHESLAVAQSPQANSEREFIRSLIAQGMTKPQIERILVAQYGPTVLALPPAHGFNLTVYILPPALLIAGVVILAVTLPRWRRRSQARAARPAPVGPNLSPADAERLETDLAHFDR
jgi:cytochrome c-type biogenesis protein CcmH